MEENLAYCGLPCHKCPIYLATREKNQNKKLQMRVEIAKKINEIYKEKIEVEDVTDCDGCKTENGRLFAGCKKCEIRKCTTQKTIENCAHCGQYPCEKLKKLFDTEPDAKKRLDQIRSSL